MKKGRVVSFKKINVGKLIKTDSLSVFLYLMFFTGLLLGILLFSKNSNIFNISEYISQNYILNRSSNDFSNCFLISFLTYFTIDFVFFVFGVSIIGPVSIPSLIFIFGYLISSLFSYNYFKYSIKGIAFNSIVLLPPIMIFAFVLIYISKLNFKFSVSLSYILFKKEKHTTINNDFLFLAKKYILLLLITLFSALVDALSGRYIMKIFNF